MKKKLFMLPMAALMAAILFVTPVLADETDNETAVTEQEDNNAATEDDSAVTVEMEGFTPIQAGGLLPDEDSELFDDAASVVDNADSSESAATYDHSHDQEIINAVKNRKTELDVSEWEGITGSTDKETLMRLEVIASYAISGHPEFYYVSLIGGAIDNGRITINFEYENGSDEELAKFNNAVDYAKKEMDKQISDDMTDLEIALVVHDYLAATCAYDYTDYYADEDNMPEYVYNMYGVLVKHSAVCQGYAEAFEYFMNYYGIPCELATSTNANHAWDVIKINGKWYHLDVTWDDSPAWDLYGYVEHTYFLMSTSSLTADDSDKSDFMTSSATMALMAQLCPGIIPEEAYTGDNVFTKATDTTYESGHFWNKTITGTYHYNATDTWYYIASSGSGSLIAYDYDDNKSETVATNDDSRWYVWGSTNSYYSECYNHLYGTGDHIYYSTANNIYLYNITADEQHIYYIPDTTDGYVYGFGCTDGVMGYTIETSYNPGKDETIIPIEISNVTENVHIWDDGQVTTEPTTTTEGVKTYTCKVCDTTKTEAIEKIPIVVPDTAISAKKGTSSKKITLTGSICDFADVDQDMITGHGILYMTEAKLGSRKLTVSTSGRTKVSFSAYKTDGSFCYTFKAASTTTTYVARTWITYKNADGETVYSYSDPIIVSYNSL